MDIGKRIKYFREQACISGRALANKVGISQSQIAKIESGVSKPSLDTLEKICSVLGLSLSKFFADNVHDVIPPRLKPLLKAANGLSVEQINILITVARQMKQ